MVNKKVKELRKKKGLSQENLATKSGLSLRTIQRVEKAENHPTGETLNRICSALDISIEELTDNETAKKTIKGKKEYLHIFDDKLVITKTPKINNLIDDYKGAVNNVFKTLMVLFIFTLIFTILAVIFYNIDKTGLAIYSGSLAFMFLIVASSIMFFTSGSTLIKKEDIYNIKVFKNINGLTISHKESGIIKKRGFAFNKEEFDSVTNTLLNEKLITEKNITKSQNTTFIILPVIMPFLIMSALKNDFAYLGIFLILYILFFTTKNAIEAIKPILNKNNK